jgi:hypothetical protein
MPTLDEEFDKEFTRISKGLESKGRYMEHWFIKDDVTPREVKDWFKSYILSLMSDVKLEKMPNASANDDAVGSQQRSFGHNRAVDYLEAKIAEELKKREV